MKRIFSILAGTVLVACAFSGLADRQVTVNNIDTGESFEMTVPDGFRMYHVNQDWLDSIPYLMEHARQGEPWAYRAIADCYRFGKGGLPVSLFNAVAYYELSGRKSDGWIDKIREENNEDPLAVLKELVDFADERDFDNIKTCINVLHKSNYQDADILIEFIDRNRRNESFEAKEILDIMNDDTKNPDELMFMSMGLSLFNCKNKKFQKEDSDALRMYLEKLPFFYSYEGVDLYGSTVSARDEVSQEASGDSVSNIRRQAIEYLLKADRYACLSKAGAKVLYSYCAEDPNSDWVKLSEEDLDRIKNLYQD